MQTDVQNIIIMCAFDCTERQMDCTVLSVQQCSLMLWFDAILLMLYIASHKDDMMMTENLCKAIEFSILLPLVSTLYYQHMNYNICMKILMIIMSGIGFSGSLRN